MVQLGAHAIANHINYRAETPARGAGSSLIRVPKVLLLVSRCRRSTEAARAHAFDSWTCSISGNDFHRRDGTIRMRHGTGLRIASWTGARVQVGHRRNL